MDSLAITDGSTGVLEQDRRICNKYLKVKVHDGLLRMGLKFENICMSCEY